jgi:hypothetical protein
VLTGLDDQDDWFDEWAYEEEAGVGLGEVKNDVFSFAGAVSVSGPDMGLYMEDLVAMSDRVIALDTCGEVSVFKNKALFVETWTSEIKVLLHGVNVGGKPLQLKRSGLTDFGEVYFNPKAAANILSFGDLRDRTYKV